MKRILLLAVSLLFMFSANGRLPDPEVNDRLQELQRCVSTIKSNVRTIEEVVINIENNQSEVSILGETLCSKIDMIGTVTSNVSCDLDPIMNEVSLVGEILCSKIDMIGVVTAEVDFTSVLDAISETDELICSKIGSFDDEGSCLDNQIDIPQDIDNLNLNVIQLLKTILLELRGCNVP